VCVFWGRGGGRERCLRQVSRVEVGGNEEDVRGVWC